VPGGIGVGVGGTVGVGLGLVVGVGPEPPILMQIGLGSSSEHRPWSAQVFRWMFPEESVQGVVSVTRWRSKEFPAEERSSEAREVGVISQVGVGISSSYCICQLQGPAALPIGDS